MINFWYKILSFFGSREYEKLGGAKRSSEWSRVRKENIKDYCEMCEKKGGLLNRLELHHILPFNLRPDLELSPQNFFTACRHCHLRFCHLNSFQSYEKDIKIEAEKWKIKRQNRP